MQENSDVSLSKMQKAIKPEIEEIIHEQLVGEDRQNALAFVAHLREKKLKPQWASANSWKVSYKGKSVCYIRLHGSAHYHNVAPQTWHVYPQGGENGEFVEPLPDVSATEAFWAHVGYCTACSKCTPRDHVMIMGKHFDHVCINYSPIFRNPDALTLEYIKHAIAVRKAAIQRGEVKVFQFVSGKSKK